MAMLEHVLGPAAVTEARVSRMWSVLRGESRQEELGGGGVVELRGPMLVLRLEGGKDVVTGTALTPGHHQVGRLEFDVRSASGECRVLPLSNWAAVFPAGTDLVARPDGVVTADTSVFDLTIETLADLRAGRFEKPFESSWHAQAFGPVE